MVTGVAAPAAAQFSTSRAFADSFYVLRRNFLLFVIPAFLFRLIGLLVPLFDHVGRIADEMSGIEQSARLVAELIAAGLTEAAVAFGTVLTLQRRPASLADVCRGLRSSIPVMIASVIYCVPNVAAGVCLSLENQFSSADQTSSAMHIVLALVSLALALAVTIITLTWYVYVPAIIFEQRGAIQGLVRSAELTKGHRWQLFGIVLLLGLFSFAVLLPISLIADVEFAELRSPTGPSISAAIAYLGLTVVRAYAAAMVIVVYCSLRAEKERITADSIAP